MSIHPLCRLRLLFPLHRPSTPSPLNRKQHLARKTRRHVHPSPKFPVKPTQPQQQPPEPHLHRAQRPRTRPAAAAATTRTSPAPLLTTLAALIVLAHLT